MAELGAGYTEFNQGNVLSAKLIASGVIESLRRSKNKVGDETQFHTSLDRVLFAAHALKARCHFSLREYKPFHALGKELIRLDPDNWEGYHYRAVYFLGTGREDGDDVVEALNLSVNKRPKNNRDHVNLAELWSLRGKYDEARKAARKYLSSSEGEINKYTVVADFFLTLASSVLADDPAQDPQKFIDDIKEKDGRYFDIEMERQYDAQLLVKIQARIHEDLDKSVLNSEVKIEEVDKLITEFVRKVDPVVARLMAAEGGD